MMDNFSLSPRKAEYVKYLYQRGEVVKTSQLAAHFGVAPSTITKTLEEIAETGLVAHSPYQGVQLTAHGDAYARFLMRRHRILALMLSRCGLEPDEACREATLFEGHVSRYVVDRMCTSLGHPIMSVCGRIEHDECCCPRDTPVAYRRERENLDIL